jgi:lipopolysaccharide/colanic/teichoic acid biosynthesis glycosyltransferase
MNLIVQNSKNIIKTVFEYLIAISCLILLIPVIVILIVLIKATGEGPVIYSQKRIGKGGRSFFIYKFRSMRCGAEEQGSLLSEKGDKRITALGRFMRKHKFDEIPNLLNVIKGEMSIIGPRPEQQFYIDQIIQKEPRYRELHFIKPGITSWGQVKYGYASNVDEMIERLEYDLFYLANRSFWFDVRIALCTIVIIFKGQGN